MRGKSCTCRMGKTKPHRTRLALPRKAGRNNGGDASRLVAYVKGTTHHSAVKRYLLRVLEDGAKEVEVNATGKAIRAACIACHQAALEALCKVTVSVSTSTEEAITMTQESPLDDADVEVALTSKVTVLLRAQ
eukprot:Sspe_Gene.5281::Locus_1738_Transcript_1_1_Confidence_1.000_Length_3497::g.5281::m.5281